MDCTNGRFLHETEGRRYPEPRRIRIPAQHWCGEHQPSAAESEWKVVDVPVDERLAPAPKPKRTRKPRGS